AGPGGYVAAIRASQLGKKVAVVEKKYWGGVCLNVGCIPSKALLDSSELYALARRSFGRHGIGVEGLAVDVPRMLARKDEIVHGLADTLRRALERAGVELLHGAGRLTGPEEVEFAPADGAEPRRLRARAILLATGSEPVELPGLPFDGKRVVTSTEALSFSEVPQRLSVLGGGYVGLELGSLWARLGARVTVVEALPRLASATDGQIARALGRSLSKQGLEFRLGTKVAEASATAEGVRAALESEGGREELSCDVLLVAAGRRPLTAGLGLENVGVELDPAGRVRVDEAYRTSVPSILAVGDLVPGPMLAHKASAEGVAAVERLAGREAEVNYDAIPSAIYTAPEVGSVGLTEEAARERGVEPKIGTYPFGGNARARSLEEAEGVVKVIAHPRTDRLLGVHILGPRASELIAECALALEFGASAEDLARTVHGHPTLGEAVREAAKLS
ncbi:MAG: dihydrolipoyl dehydrogenase, partial [Deltaproteobacteria bacterium]|nr:dihydrolipoyl dehydrogenase [Deltaproteobacteria bacterium]